MSRTNIVFAALLLLLFFFCASNFVVTITLFRKCAQEYGKLHERQVRAVELLEKISAERKKEAR